MLHREGEIRIPSGCAISGIFSKSGERMTGDAIVKSIGTMHSRSNGLGGGFAGYGIYPQYKELYAFHLFYDTLQAKERCENYLERHFDIADMSKIPTVNHPAIMDKPLIWRYFVTPLPSKLADSQMDEEEYTARCVIKINSTIDGAYVFSSGKNMGVFKAVGYPEDVGEFYNLAQYKGHCWTAHGRYPTNTPGWWGGAHPFAMLNYSVVHNGEISSYDTNRRFMEMFGYRCTLLTDTEVITYMIDYLHRRKKFSMEEVAAVIAAPFWSEIDHMEESKKKELTYLRTVFSDMLITGPFSILVGFENGIMALNDRLKLRSMVVGEKEDRIYIASEEAAIRIIEPNLTKLWAPKGGEAVVFTLEGGEFPCR